MKVKAVQKKPEHTNYDDGTRPDAYDLLKACPPGIGHPVQWDGLVIVKMWSRNRRDVRSDSNVSIQTNDDHSFTVWPSARPEHAFTVPAFVLPESIHHEFRHENGAVKNTWTENPNTVRREQLHAALQLAVLL